MVASYSRLAYSDCFDLFEKAIADPKGIKIKFANPDDAYHFRLRLHQARKIDRKDNTEIYEPGDVMYGKSVYDRITCRIRNDGTGVWLRLERVDAREFEVESLNEPEKEPEFFIVRVPTEEKHSVQVPIEPIRPQPKFVRRV